MSSKRVGELAAAPFPAGRDRIADDPELAPVARPDPALERLGTAFDELFEVVGVPERMVRLGRGHDRDRLVEEFRELAAEHALRRAVHPLDAARPDGDDAHQHRIEDRPGALAPSTRGRAPASRAGPAASSCASRRTARRSPRRRPSPPPARRTDNEYQRSSRSGAGALASPRVVEGEFGLVGRVGGQRVADLGRHRLGIAMARTAARPGSGRRRRSAAGAASPRSGGCSGPARRRAGRRCPRSALSRMVAISRSNCSLRRWLRCWSVMSSVTPRPSSCRRRASPARPASSASARRAPGGGSRSAPRPARCASAPAAVVRIRRATRRDDLAADVVRHRPTPSRSRRAGEPSPTIPRRSRCRRRRCPSGRRSAAAPGRALPRRCDPRRCPCSGARRPRCDSSGRWRAAGACRRAPGRPSLATRSAASPAAASAMRRPRPRRAAGPGSARRRPATPARRRPARRRPGWCAPAGRCRRTAPCRPG